MQVHLTNFLFPNPLPILLLTFFSSKKRLSPYPLMSWSWYQQFHNQAYTARSKTKSGKLVGFSKRKSFCGCLESCSDFATLATFSASSLAFSAIISVLLFFNSSILALCLALSFTISSIAS